ncbi:MAG: hypothetical protein JSV36_13315 [Anaerolineae bacterium]|nr:MAG: hypothetical protein JSV36_13315 [Anaerolineae bacterium]
MRRRPIVPAALYGLAFTACGCLFSLIFGQAATLTCTRVEPSQIECVRQSKWLGWLPVSAVSLQHVEGAEVAQSCDDEGCSYRVELTTAEGIVPLTSYYSSGSRSKKEAADRINAFLRNSEGSSLTVKSDAGLLAFVLPLVFVLVGPLIIMWSIFRATIR